jgi:hypothetical protein
VTACPFFEVNAEYSNLGDLHVGDPPPSGRSDGSAAGRGLRETGAPGRPPARRRQPRRRADTGRQLPDDRGDLTSGGGAANVASEQT